MKTIFCVSNCEGRRVNLVLPSFVRIGFSDGVRITGITCNIHDHNAEAWIEDDKLVIKFSSHQKADEALVGILEDQSIN